MFGSGVELRPVETSGGREGPRPGLIYNGLRRGRGGRGERGNLQKGLTRSTYTCDRVLGGGPWADDTQLNTGGLSVHLQDWGFWTPTQD